MPQQKRTTHTKRRSTIGLGFTGDPYGVRKLVGFAEQAEKSGYGYFFMCEDFFLREAIATIACVAYTTKKLKVSTGVISPYTRNPILTALTMSTLNELADGRAILTLGSGVQPLMESMGVKFEHPLAAMRETVEIIKKFQTGKKMDYPGTFFNIKGVKFGENPYFGMDSFEPTSYPIYIAAMGPKMLALAGEIGDGTLFSAGVAVQHAKDSVEFFSKGASAAGKDPGSLDVACYILTALGAPSKAIRKFAAWEVAYSPPAFLEPLDVSEDQAMKIRKVLETKGEADAMALLPERVVRLLAACGTREEVQSRFEEYRKAGVTTPVMVPLGVDPMSVIGRIT